MTLMGVRLHLVVVERDGYVRRSTLREKPGRPAMIYTLTPKAEELFPKRYDQLAGKLLEAVEADRVADGLQPVLRAAALSLAAPLKGKLNGGGRGARVQQVTRVLDELGAFTSSEAVDGGYLIHEYNCLYYSVAEERREVCSMCAQFLQELLGVAPEPRAYLLDGAGRCSYFVPEE